MRKFILLTALLIAVIYSYAQLIDPQPGLKLDRKIQKIKVVRETIVKTDNESSHDKRTTKVIDSIIQGSSRVAFYGLTSLSNSGSDLINSLNGTGRVGIMLFPSKKKNFKINIGINMINANPPKGTSKDSLDFNSLMFPETGNFGFLFSPSIRIGDPLLKDADHSFWLESTFSYRKVAIEDPATSFKTLSYTIGVKYQWDYAVDDTNSISFSLMPYFNYFNVPNEDVKKFKTLLNDPLFDNLNKGAAIPSIGGKMTVQFKNFMFYFDIRNNMKTQGFNDDNPFKGTKVNIGFASAFSLKSF